ncbi:hypothetical protein BTVI_41713 [Pitangus sulphuratus]|nr:hypothetical protein BTVI_41713 [Pitangus sulphuratus]
MTSAREDNPPCHHPGCHEGHCDHSSNGGEKAKRKRQAMNDQDDLVQGLIRGKATRDAMPMAPQELDNVKYLLDLSDFGKVVL